VKLDAYRVNDQRRLRRARMDLWMLRDGRLYLSGIAKLARHLTGDNREGLLKRASVGQGVGAAVGLGAHRVQGLEGARPADRAGTSRPASLPAATIEPLGPARHRVCFTASTELRDKLERLQALMRSSIPDGDLAKIIDVAVTKELERIEAKRFAKTKAPRKALAETDTTPSSRRIPAAVRRVVHERDGGRCTYEDKRGRRCTKRHDLEFHHKNPFGLV